MYIFEGLLDDIEVIPLRDAVRKMDGIRFPISGNQAETTFKYDLVQGAIDECVTWARTSDEGGSSDETAPRPNDAFADLSTQLGRLKGKVLGGGGWLSYM